MGVKFNSRQLLCLFVTVFSLFFISTASSISNHKSLFSIRGGLVPQASDSDGNYYEQFILDYGSTDNKRVAGALRGFLKSGALSAVIEKDPFAQWLNNHIEKGSEPVKGRVKPFYAADFGTKKDLPRGENPKIIIVQRRLEADKDGVLVEPPAAVDVEVREIRNPLLRARCNFAVRYIVPNRVNIINIMEMKKRFSSGIEVETDERGNKRIWEKMEFKPSLLGRMIGKRSKIIRREVLGKGSAIGNVGADNIMSTRKKGVGK